MQTLLEVFFAACELDDADLSVSSDDDQMICTS